jgi:signal transduction histidine kinase/CheY-like chemotaxis protein
MQPAPGPTKASSPEGRPGGLLRRAIKRPLLGFSLRLHQFLFIAFIIVSAVPIVALALWESKTSFLNEMESVRERHLLVARNLTSTMSRYVKDLQAVVGLAFRDDPLSSTIPGLTDLLTSLNVLEICIFGPSGKPDSCLKGLSGPQGAPLPLTIFDSLRALAAANIGNIAISNLYHDAANRPVFYLVKSMPEGRLGLAVVSTAYLVSLQQSIAFGDHGHAVIVDSKGQVIAHPFKDWVAASRDISGVPVVAAMMRGETGVGQFYSPAFNGNMIAGYAVVPETGWGVMVPQPISELYRRAGVITTLAFVIAAMSFTAATAMSWLIALFLTRPVRAVAEIAEAVLDGNDEVSVPQFRGLVPREIRRLGDAFNTMLSGLRRRAIETTLALHQAETSSRAKTQFLANMSHEIRTPLNEIVGMVELMQLTELAPSQRRYLDTAMQSSRALLRLIDDILDLSKIEAGRLELDRTPFHLPSLIHDVRMLMADQARAKGLTLAVLLPDSLNIMVVGDAHRLLQILTNLVGNAIKFTSQGSVTIRVALDREFGNSIRLRFEISDTGIGIPPDKHDAIFDAFTQADSSMTRRYGGTGLGLSIVRQLCHMMDGDIGVDSVVGAGSTFWFTVLLERSVGPPVLAPTLRPAPAQSALQESLRPSESFVSPSGKDFQDSLERAGRTSISILMVEDNPANMRVTQALLESLGCKVTSARNGMEAVAIYRDQPFDLVLMDCQMPEMDGYEATRAIRQIETYQSRRTPIIALTAHAMQGSREASLASGMDDQLTKPLTLAMLTTKLLEWLAAGATIPTNQANA